MLVLAPSVRKGVRSLLNASLAAKMLTLLALIAALFLGILLLVYLPTVERELLRDRRASLKQLVEVAHSLLADYHQRVETGELSLSEAQTRAIQRIGKLRYEHNDYFWLSDTNLPFPRLILHPILADLQGVDTDDPRFRHASQMQFGPEGRIEVFPSGDKNLAQAFVEVALESGDGFVTYAWPRPTPEGPSQKYYPKESYIKLFEPWGWAIGTGAYIDDIQTRISRLRAAIFISTGAILAAAMLVLALLIALFVTRPMNALVRYAEQVSAGEWNPPVRGRFYAETARLKAVLTQMVRYLEAALHQADSRLADAHRETQKARRLTRKLNALFSSMSELVASYEIVPDPAGQPANYRLTDCNATFEETIGLRKKDLVGKLATELFQTDSPPHLETYARVAAGGPPVAFETHNDRWNRHFLISAVSSQRNEFFTVATDITTRKRAEQLVAEKNKELEQVLYAASHDLRSPLVNIDGYGRELEFSVADILAALDGKPSTPTPQLTQVLQTSMAEMIASLGHIRHSTRQMDALIKGLLELSRTGRSTLSLAPLDMDSLLAKVVSAIEFRAKNAGARLHVIPPLPPCLADPIQLARVFSNLIDNALKYLDPARPGLITVSGSIENGRATYCVADNGIGIDPANHAKIFDLFRRLDPAATEGEGLGLAIVRQILGRLDGEIHLDSAPGVGSRFFVSLPLAHPHDSPPTPVPPPAAG